MMSSLGKRVTDSLILHTFELMAAGPIDDPTFEYAAELILRADSLEYGAAHAVQICDIFVDREILSCTCSPKNGLGDRSITCCDCPYQCDYDEDGFHTALDLGFMIDALFAGGTNPHDPTCPTSRSDFDNDGFPTALDLGNFIDALFAGGSAPVDPCSP
jgi:hypothetical protein